MDAVTSKRKDIMKDIILGLHRGLTAEQAKERFEKEVGNVTSTEIAEIEQSLIGEGMTTDEIKKFCNVHTLIFKAALQKTATPETFPSHPVHLFKLENREIEKQIKEIRDALNAGKGHGTGGLQSLKKSLGEMLAKLKGAEIHYERKEQLLFPYLEKVGFMGPSKVMWGKDNEIRELLRAAAAGISAVADESQFEAWEKKSLEPLLEEVDGMIFKEENILFPAAIEKLKADDWVGILSESDEIGYAFIATPHEADMLVKEFRSALQEEPVFSNGEIVLPTGKLNLQELLAMLNMLPVDVTFVDKDDTVRYFSTGKDRVFSRTKSIIGRKVQNCHPPQSLPAVEKILKSFKDGTASSSDFWINFKGKFVYIRYAALRDSAGHYLGTIEFTQDATAIKNLNGEKRLSA